MIDPHKEKYHKLYWELAFAAARQSQAHRAQVGAVLVMPTGMISIGWNGMPAGLDNLCETPEFIQEENCRRWKTKPEVIHAERNAIDKMTRQGVPTAGSILFVTHSPCLECCKALHGLGLKAVYYHHLHDDTRGFPLLNSAGVRIIRWDEAA